MSPRLESARYYPPLLINFAGLARHLQVLHSNGGVAACGPFSIPLSFICTRADKNGLGIKLWISRAERSNTPSGAVSHQPIDTRWLEGQYVETEGNTCSGDGEERTDNVGLRYAEPVRGLIVQVWVVKNWRQAR